MTTSTDNHDAQAELVRQMTAPAWRSEAGSDITGTVVRLALRETEYGKHLVVTLKTEHGDYRAVHCYHSVLSDAVWALKPTVGSMLSVYYHGRVDRDGKPSYHSYTVLDPNAPAEVEFDWDTAAAIKTGQPAVSEPEF